MSGTTFKMWSAANVRPRLEENQKISTVKFIVKIFPPPNVMMVVEVSPTLKKTTSSSADQPRGRTFQTFLIPLKSFRFSFSTHGIKKDCCVHGVHPCQMVCVLLCRQRNELTNCLGTFISPPSVSVLALYQIAQHCCWNAAGPSFPSLHWPRTSCCFLVFVCFFFKAAHLFFLISWNQIKTFNSYQSSRVNFWQRATNNDILSGII